MSRVVEILIAAAPDSRIEAVTSVRAVPGRGLEGDRYFAGAGTFSQHPQQPDYELTLIQKEHIDAFSRASGLSFTSREARRNIVTEGVDLNGLVGKEFMIGGVLIRGIRLCEPCSYLAKATNPEVLRGLVHKGGLRAQILSAGVVHPGDPIVVRSAN